MYKIKLTRLYICTSTQWWNVSYVRATCLDCKTAIIRLMQNIYQVQCSALTWWWLFYNRNM